MFWFVVTDAFVTFTGGGVLNPVRTYLTSEGVGSYLYDLYPSNLTSMVSQSQARNPAVIALIH